MPTASARLALWMRRWCVGNPLPPDPRPVHDRVEPTPQGDGDPRPTTPSDPPPDPDAVRSNMDLPGMDAPESQE